MNVDCTAHVTVGIHILVCFCMCDGSISTPRYSQSILIAQQLTNIRVTAVGHTADPVCNEESEEKEMRQDEDRSLFFSKKKTQIFPKVSL